MQRVTDTSARRIVNGWAYWQRWSQYHSLRRCRAPPISNCTAGYRQTLLTCSTCSNGGKGGAGGRAAVRDPRDPRWRWVLQRHGRQLKLLPTLPCPKHQLPHSPLLIHELSTAALHLHGGRAAKFVFLQYTAL